MGRARAEFLNVVPGESGSEFFGAYTMNVKGHFGLSLSGGIVEVLV